MSNPKLVSTWNPKGGQGKSLLAINLAGAAVGTGYSALVVDLDPQGTAIQYTDNPDLLFPITGRMPESAPEEEIVIFDEQASDWELPSRNLLVMPVRPSRDQFKTFAQAHRVAVESGRKVIVVATGGDVRRELEAEIVDRLVIDYDAHVLPDSGIYTRAANIYTTIFDTRLTSVYGAATARLTMIDVLADILELE